jgi:O-antigen biosynthesis protein WbqP
LLNQRAYNLNIRVAMKRLFDGVFSVILLLVLLIPMILIAVMVKFTSKGGILYWSDRVGKDNVIFKMPKFRSMMTDTPAMATHLLDNPQSNLTSIGNFLRKYSLDEFPQLWSIVKGDMSFVGPRPALFNQDDLVKLRSDKGVDKAMPGLTGWAQINGRDELPIVEKVKMDAEYLERQSFMFDLKILWLTLLKVVKKDGVSH